MADAPMYIDFATNADEVSPKVDQLVKTTDKLDNSVAKLVKDNDKLTASNNKLLASLKAVDTQAKYTTESLLKAKLASVGEGGGGSGFMSSLKDTFGSERREKLLHGAEHIPEIGHSIREFSHMAEFAAELGPALAVLAPIALVTAIAFKGINDVLERNKQLHESEMKGIHDFQQAMSDADESVKKWNENVSKLQNEKGMSAAERFGGDVRQAIFFAHGHLGHESAVNKMNRFANTTGLPGAREAWLDAQRLNKSEDALNIAKIVASTGLANMDEVVKKLNNGILTKAGGKDGLVDAQKVAQQFIQRMVPNVKITQEMMDSLDQKNQFRDNLDAVGKYKNQEDSRDIGLIYGAGNYAKQLLEDSNKNLTYQDRLTEEAKAANELRLKQYNAFLETNKKLEDMAKTQGELNAILHDSLLNLFGQSSYKTQIIRNNENMAKYFQGLDEAEAAP